MSKYIILQSGFVSLTEKGLVRDAINNDLMVSGILNKDYLRQSNNGFYNTHISKLHKESLVVRDLNRNFDFIENVISAGLKAFGTASLYEWLEIQNLYANLTNMHTAFICDMINRACYIKRPVKFSNKKPPLPDRLVVPPLEMLQWVKLVKASTTAVSKKNLIDLYDIFGNANAPASATNRQRLYSTSVVDFVAERCYQDNDISDLLTTLYVIFGDRSGISDVAE